MQVDNHHSVPETRVAAVRRALAEKEIDGLLLTDRDNIGYVSGFTGSAAQVLITPSESLLVTDSRYTLVARAQCPGFEIVETPAGSGGYVEAVQQVLAARPVLHRLGFEAAHAPVAQWEKWRESSPNVEWVSTDSIVETRRLTKDIDEIARIRRAIAVAETAFETIKPRLRAGAAEREIALELEFAMRRGGAEGVAFDTIVASGPQGALPHHHPNDRRLETGDLVTLDWGATVNGYNSDITRTMGISHVSEKQRAVYAVVLEAQRRAIAAIAPGKNGREIDAVARDFIAEQGYGQAFGHSLGHSLGRSVHDGPGFSVRTESLVLAPGMVMTVEPGIYLEGWGGIRIEEDVLVTDAGCEILTNLPNALEVL